jgi:hypothetical protein
VPRRTGCKEILINTTLLQGQEADEDTIRLQSTAHR